jgi:hypothetical protein
MLVSALAIYAYPVGFLTSVTADLFQVSATDCKIQKLAASAVIGIERIAYIGFRPRTFEDRHVSFISVPLIETDRVHNPQLLLIYYDYFTARDEWVPNYASAIAWRSLLSIERLLQAYKASEVSGVSVLGPFSNLARAFREFASYYCGIIGDVPLVRAYVQRMVEADLLLPSKLC